MVGPVKKKMYREHLADSLSVLSRARLNIRVIAAIVLKLGLYGIIWIILSIFSEASMSLRSGVFVIGVITIIYASFSTLRTTDVKEIIAYSSVSHVAVYLIGGFSNTVQGIGGVVYF